MNKRRRYLAKRRRAAIPEAQRIPAPVLAMLLAGFEETLLRLVASGQLSLEQRANMARIYGPHFGWQESA